MPNFPVSPAKTAALQREMEAYHIQEADIEEKFIRGSGAGGQKINKTASCVWLKHVPTGLEVKCQQERSQALNRFLARRLLVQKIVNQIEGKKSAEEQERQKIRRRKRRRSKRAREKMLANKRHRSEIKQSRQKVFHDE
ncbi:MAG: peptide chain release factor-like protein [Deltaproteobacteria bacterium]|nr:peptide chain release factor-like protein [Deltaproteobacteria bacterium]MBI4223410.1 peptide chain release factor-like protein [Deltaproteobacteria bacterium]